MQAWCLSQRVTVMLVAAFAFAIGRLPVAIAKDSVIKTGDLGVYAGYVDIKESGFAAKNLQISPVYGIEASQALGRRINGVMSFELGGGTYVNGTAGLNYFPFSVSARQVAQDAYSSFQYDDSIKPFFGGGLCFGRLVVANSVEGLGAYQLDANYFGFYGDTGAIMAITSGISAKGTMSLSVLQATTDSTVAMSGIKISVLLGVLYDL